MRSWSRKFALMSVYLKNIVYGWLLISFILLLTEQISAEPSNDVYDIAVIGHPDISTDDISFQDLRKILLGDKKFWSDGETITLLVQAPVARERSVLLQKVYNMSEVQFRQYWISKIFRAEVTSGPKVVLSNDMAFDLVKVIPGAVALVNANQVPQGVKVFKIDGLLPKSNQYRLR